MANNISVKDSSGTATTVKTTETAGVHTLHHSVDSSALPSGAATSAKQDTIIGHVDGVETLLSGGLPAALSAGGGVKVGVVDALPAGTNAIGKLAANSGVDVGDVDVTSVIAGTGATNLGKAEDAAHSSGDTGVMALAVRDDTLDVRSGTENDYEPLHTDANGALWVHPTDSIAHDAADAGNGIKLAGKAETALSGVTLVADGDRSDLYCGVDGVLIVRPNCNLEDVVQERTTNTDGASTAFASGLAAPGAGIRLWIKSVTICNSSATFCTVDLRDGSAGSVLWTFPVPATGGVTHVFDPPLKLTANTALAFDASAATTTITISVNGFKSKV